MEHVLSFEVFRWTTLTFFVGLCVLSYFSGMLFGRVYVTIKQTSWERASLASKAAYWLLRAFREYIAPGEHLPDPREHSHAPAATFVGGA